LATVPGNASHHMDEPASGPYPMRNLHRLIFGLTILATAAATLAPAPAQGIATGQTLSGRLVLGGKSVPLPAGQWTVAGLGAGSMESSFNAGAPGLVWNVVLFRATSDGRTVDAMIELNINELSVADGWGMAADCSRTDLALSVVRYKAGWDSSCFFVTHTLFSEKNAATPAWAQATQMARQKGWQIPGTAVTAGARASNRRDVIDVRYHFTPAFHNIPEGAIESWDQSPWMASRLERDQRRLAFARNLTEWVVVTSGHVEAGLKNRLPANIALPAPGLNMLALENESQVKKRMASLQTLRNAGLLSSATYEEQLHTISEKGLDPTSSVVDPARIALYKTLGYRPAVSLANIFIDYYWIGLPFATGVLVLLQVTINSVKFYFHELAWDRLGLAGQRSDFARTVDFTYGGVDR
jgi:uncharacterized membrane protein